jgi:hypothetical protein
MSKLYWKRHNLPQGSPEWLDLRKQRISGTKANPLKLDGLSKGTETVIRDILATFDPDWQPKPNVSNQYTEWGHLFEPACRRAVERELGVETHEVGFIEVSKYGGCSPDGLTKTQIHEYKCLQYDKHMKVLKTGKIDPKYLAQMHWNLMCMLEAPKKEYKIDTLIYAGFHPHFKVELEGVPLCSKEDSLYIQEVPINWGMVERFRDKLLTIESIIEDRLVINKQQVEIKELKSKLLKAVMK